jgi:hypothetical protein
MMFLLFLSVVGLNIVPLTSLIMLLLAAHPSVGNEVFCDTAMPPFVRFAELFSIVMMQFDMFHVQFLQQYLRNG